MKKIFRKKILVADDDPAIVDSIQMILETVGYDVDTTINGNTVKEMKGNFPDLLLLDIWMSGQDGRDICKYMKAHSETQHIPIILISANRDTREIAKEAGADDFITKPFEMEDLLHKVELHLH
jgi:DNA-binding response OmpR family regulator